MKYISSIAGVLLIAAVQFLFTSCNNSGSTTVLPGAWDKMGDFEGIPRSGAVSFVINGQAYVGTGFNYQSNAKLVDFWRYNPVDDSWTQVTDFPGTPRSLAVGFSMNGKGYVGTGSDINSVVLKDFWEFDPAGGTNGTWTPIADFPTERTSALAFTVNDGTTDRGFVGGGYTLSSLKDLWEYQAGAWVKRPSIGGSKRQGAFVMVIDNIAYVGGGLDNDQIVPDFYRFDVSKIDTNPWLPMTSLTGKDINGNAIVQPRPRSAASTFTIGGFGYLTAGSAGSDMWQYTPPVLDANGLTKSGDIWVQYFSFTTNVPVAGSARTLAVSFGIGNYGYVATGVAGNTRYDDCWRFDPTGIEPDNK